MDTSILVLLPPVIVLTLALLTRNVLTSLLAGIFSATLISTNFSPLSALSLGLKRMIYQTGLVDVYTQSGDYSTFYLYGFLVFLGILNELLTHTGGLRLYTNALLKRLKTKKQAEIATLILPMFLFIDDYLNALVTGSIMQPVTDHFKIPRAKLAFLLCAVSAPLAVIVPASSWVGMILTQLTASGAVTELTSNTIITIEPFKLYLYIIPFLFYPIFSIMGAWLVTIMQISFGKMQQYEAYAVQTNNLYGGKQPTTINPSTDFTLKHGTWLDVILPVGTLFAAGIAVLLYTGDYYLFGGVNSFVKAFVSGNSVLALFVATGMATIASTLRGFLKKQITASKYFRLVIQGLRLMKESLAVLFFAWVFSVILQNDLHTGEYLSLMFQTIDNSFIPTIIFIATVITAAATGSSWGAIMFLMPLALPLMANSIGVPPLGLSDVIPLAIAAAAVVSGAVAGSHLSPITDSTIIASTSSGAHHLDHVKSHASYSIAPLVGSLIAFLIVGLLYERSVPIATLTALLAGLAASWMITLIRAKVRKKST